MSTDRNASQTAGAPPGKCLTRPIRAMGKANGVGPTDTLSLGFHDNH
jgi:hypothetical protein